MLLRVSLPGVKVKTTRADFEVFKDAVITWQKSLGLTDWTIYFNHDRLDGEFARTNWTAEDSIAVITLSTNWDKLRPKTDDQIRQLALHELLHVLLAPFCAEAENRYATQKQLNTVEHSIIRRLETVLHGQKENGGSVSTKGQSA